MASGDKLTIFDMIKNLDGEGSGLDADKIDAIDSTQFIRSDINDVVNGILTFKQSSNYTTFTPIRVFGQDLMYRTFYVDAENGDDTNDGSSSAPFKTIGKAFNATPIGGFSEITIIGDYTLEKNEYVGINKTILIVISDGHKFTAKWYEYNDTAALYHIDFSYSSLGIRLVQTDTNGDNPSQIVIPENDTGKDKSIYLRDLFHLTTYYKTHTSNLLIQTYSVVSGTVIEINDGVFTSVYKSNYNWGNFSFGFTLHSNVDIVVNTANNALLADFGNKTGILQFATQGSIKNQDGDSITLKDIVSGIVKDADSGNPINLISNFNFSD